jgi:hypothetical protein
VAEAEQEISDVDIAALELETLHSASVLKVLAAWLPKHTHGSQAALWHPGGDREAALLLQPHQHTKNADRSTAMRHP